MTTAERHVSAIHLATDHAGFLHKESVKQWLQSEGFTVIDHGADVLNETDDFTDFVSLAARAVQEDENTLAIIFGGSGQGEAMMANRFKGVRATVFYGGSDEVIQLSREHNNANVLSIGARFVSIDESKRVIWSWLSGHVGTDEKYDRRNKKLDSLS